MDINGILHDFSNLSEKQVLINLAQSFALKEAGFAADIDVGARELRVALVKWKNGEITYEQVLKIQKSLISIMRTAVLGEIGLYLSLVALAECAYPQDNMKV